MDTPSQGDGSSSFARIAGSSDHAMAALHRGRPMRIAIVNETYAPQMGYAANCLSKALVDAGAEVHVVATSLPPYYYAHDFTQSYGKFLDADRTAGTVEMIGGVHVHRLPHHFRLGKVRFTGLEEKLATIRPDIVQTFVAISWTAIDSARLQKRHGYKLFTGNHTTASVYPIASRKVPLWHPARIRDIVMRGLHGRMVSWRTEKCYGVTPDCSEIAWRYFGVERHKVETVSLGVDTTIFHDRVSESAREHQRSEWGVGPNEIACIYTGRFSEDKNPLILAKAVDLLARQGEPFRAIFVGDGRQAEAIKACMGSRIVDFKPFHELGGLYRASDIGVWPTQESMSMLDAAACGIPIVVNNTIHAVERIAGNGLVYELGNPEDLARVLQSLKPAEYRATLGGTGARRMAADFSWSRIAKDRLMDYQAALGT